MKRLVLLGEPVSVALETLRSHKMRSFLMLLGIILYVSTLFVVIAKFPRAPMFPPQQPRFALAFGASR